MHKTRHSGYAHQTSTSSIIAANDEKMALPADSPLAMSASALPYPVPSRSGYTKITEIRRLTIRQAGIQRRRVERRWQP